MPNTAEHDKDEPQAFVPALRFKWASGIYDLVIEYFTRGKAHRSSSVEAVALQAGETILDLSCGTGKLSIAPAQVEPGASITGYDIDPNILDMARKKVGLQSEASTVTFLEVNVTDAASLLNRI
jgi:ubiquinone/menaquinone biosynthesis C-methylase UbiE